MRKKAVIDFIKNHKFSYIAGILFMFLASFTQTLLPKVVGKIIDILKQNGFNHRLVNINIGYIVLISVGTFLFTYTWRNLVIGNSRRLECYLRETLFTHLQKMSPEFYSKKKTGDLIAYAVNDVSAVRMSFGPASAQTINGLVICVASIYSMFAINAKLALVTLAPVPVVILLMLIIGSLVKRQFKKVQENFAAVSGKVQENIYGIRVIKAYVREDNEIVSFKALNNQMMDSNIKMIRTASFLAPVIEFCFSVSFVLNLIIGGNLVLGSVLSLGDFVTLNGYLTMIMFPVLSIGRVITIFQRGMASLKRINEILSIKPEINYEKGISDQPLEGELEFTNLSFSYPEADKKTLDSISLKVPKGRTLGIVGKTGSGKSTLASLLFHLYNVRPGEISVDGRDINDYSPQALRDKLGLVPQDNFLFSATLKDNITFFKDIYSDQEVENAAKTSHIYDNILRFPERFNTVLGERGVNLSGGQKQRVSIARAIIKNPAVLILDDALSAVDTVTEAQILDNLKKIRKDKTTVIIAHRISAVENADEIIVLDNGKIRERGTHFELLKKGGLYHEIYIQQYKDRKNGLSSEAS